MIRCCCCLFSTARKVRIYPDVQLSRFRRVWNVHFEFPLNLHKVKRPPQISYSFQWWKLRFHFNFPRICVLPICVQNARFVQVVSCFHLIDWISVSHSFPAFINIKQFFLQFFQIYMLCAFIILFWINVFFRFRSPKTDKTSQRQRKGSIQGSKASAMKGLPFNKLKRTVIHDTSDSDE